ncbi:serine/threonine protein kinase [Streptomyces canus]|uniref:serine/threonine protein kinase n=1 Tax=Streptomyces canus TaxID=58343 RepID=UPI0027812E35|nr:serine/threonine-protein kinase [Streptomyces canus]MDQ1069617.1 tRNA A-37 threonylcarbamoyl transferase component Bud32 [Streptomyces canus]
MNSAEIAGGLSPLGPDDPREVAGYRLLARIGEGGMGSVYLSRTRGKQPVALKVIRREYAQDEEFRRRFEQEATSARRVQGYHIVPVVDHDTTGPQPWLATTYVPGLALDQILTGHGTLPLPAVLQLTGCAAEALHAVHKAGVIHRDMKPSNILIGSEGPWIIDFGIARAADATQLTRSGGLIGTPQFMSPEHANGDDLTPSTDVFSLGLIAAVAATGRHPYGDSGAITLATKIANTEFRPPDLTAYPEPLRTVLERTLAADPAARPTPAELAELCQKLSGRPLRDFTGWLPAPVAAEIAHRERLARQQIETEPGPDSEDAAGAATMAPGSVAGAATTAPHSVAAAVPPGFVAAADTAPPGVAASGGYTPTAASRPGDQPHHAPAPPVPPTRSAAPPPQGAPHPSGPPTVPAPARSRTPLSVGAVALAVVVVAAGAWIFTQHNDTDKDAKGSGGGAASSASDGSQATATPSTDASPTANAASNDYTEIFKNKPLTLRAQFTDTRFSYTTVDLDAPKIDTNALSEGKGNELQYEELGGNYTLRFLTTMGKSAGTTPEECAEGAAANALPSELDGDDQGELLTPGTVLCTVTDEDNLAMLNIKDVVVQKDDAGYKARDYVTELTLWKAP